jgi:phosphatidylserine/phosphatidylglycerophosphate/cardiolipin synthase-like enzyme
VKDKDLLHRITIDSALSFNFTKAAEEKNAENLLIIRNKKLAEIYIDNWYISIKNIQTGMKEDNKINRG